MSYLQDITARFPVRKRDEEKEAFRKWAVAQGKTLGYSARVEELARGRHCNVVFGSPEHAQVIYTAHYDTPARLPIPNLMTPRNIPMSRPVWPPPTSCWTASAPSRRPTLTPSRRRRWLNASRCPSCVPPGKARARRSDSSPPSRPRDCASACRHRRRSVRGCMCCATTISSPRGF